MIFFNAIKKKYTSKLFSRQEKHPDVFYFSPDDFSGLSFLPYEFRSNEDAILRGGFYYYGTKENKPLVIFEHGLGSGHRSYMREIEILAKRGYLVFSYDHSGCGASGGEGAMGLAHSLSDLDAAITSLKTLDFSSERQISVIGHSWGGFSAMNILKFHPDLHSVVAMAGFISVKCMLEGLAPHILALYRKSLYALECESSGAKYAECDARNSLTASDARVLIIHSKDDPVVSFRLNFLRLKEALGGRDNIKFLEQNGKGHNPNYTEIAVAELGKFSKAVALHRKQKHTDDENKAFISQFNWNKITEQDMSVFEEIFKTIEG